MILFFKKLTKQRSLRPGKVPFPALPPQVIIEVLALFNLFHLSEGLVSELLVLPGEGQVRPSPPLLAWGCTIAPLFMLIYQGLDKPCSTDEHFNCSGLQGRIFRHPPGISRLRTLVCAAFKLITLNISPVLENGLVFSPSCQKVSNYMQLIKFNFLKILIVWGILFFFFTKFLV